MKIGSLVNFHSSAWIFAAANDRYKNPGLILDLSPSDLTRFRATVLWTDGRITTEFDSYLNAID